MYKNAKSKVDCTIKTKIRNKKITIRINIIVSKKKSSKLV